MRELLLSHANAKEFGRKLSSAMGFMATTTIDLRPFLVLVVGSQGGGLSECGIHSAFY